MNHLALADLFRFHVNLRREGLIYTQRNCSWVSGHSNRTAYEILVKDLRGFVYFSWLQTWPTNWTEVSGSQVASK